MIFIESKEGDWINLEDVSRIYVYEFTGNPVTYQVMLQQFNGDTFTWKTFKVLGDARKWLAKQLKEYTMGKVK